MRLEEINEKIVNKKKKIETIIKYFEDENNIKNGEPGLIITNPKVFFDVISLETVQGKAPQVEKFLSKRLSWKKLSASENKGDFYDEESDKYIELKVSFPNKANTLNFRQIRLWQPVDFYVGIYVDEDILENSLVFKISHEEMEKLILEHGCATHGTKQANENNNNIEYSYTLNLKNQALVNEWKEKYFDIQLYNQIFKEM